MIGLAEYIWLDGDKPTQKVRSKARVVDLPEDGSLPEPDSLPVWNYDGSSTYQASGGDSDLMLHPVYVVHDPIRADGSVLVMCEVMYADGTPHPTNHRAELRNVLEKGGNKLNAWFGFEQEYTILEGRVPIGWPEKGYPAPQGPFYCGVGSEEAFGRDFVEAHTRACIDAGLMIYGINAEVLPGQWEFQIGYRGFEGDDDATALNVADHLWLARWLLYRIGEDFDLNPTLHPKPIKGDWNGSGMHTNFSTDDTRDSNKGMAEIERIVEALSKKHKEHIAVYGAGLEERLTGLHETAHIGEFKHGVANRGASIRIPKSVSEKGYGYLEDRRPGANANPYEVACRMLKTTLGID